MVGKGALQALDDQRLNGAVRIGDQIDGALVLHRLGVAPLRAQQGARVVYRGTRDGFELFHESERPDASAFATPPGPVVKTVPTLGVTCRRCGAARTRRSARWPVALRGAAPQMPARR